MSRSIFVTIEGPAGKTDLTGYMFFWAKAVVGFVPTHHCAKCLKGPFMKTSGQWAPPLGTRREFILPPAARALYICGVSRKGYDKNLHAPVEHEEGAPLIVIPMLDDQQLFIENAKLMAIPPLPDGWNGLPKSFTTCRNWAWAGSVFGYPFPRETGVSTLRGQRSVAFLDLEGRRSR